MPEETPSITDTTEFEHSLVNAIWQDGWKAGHRRGHDIGFSNGSSTLGRGWYFVICMVFFMVGLFLGMGMPILLELANTPVAS